MKIAMIRILLALGLCCLLAGGLAAQTQSPAPATDKAAPPAKESVPAPATPATAPPLKAEPPEVVFEDAYAELKHDRTVKLTNISEAPVEIREAKGSCGCTTTGVEKKNLAPGESTTMTVTFRGARSQAGTTVEKKVTVTTTIPGEAGSLVIPVHAKVTAAIIVTPNVVKLDEVERGTELERTIHLSATDGLSFAVTGVTTSGDVASVTPTSTEPAMEQTLTVKVAVPADTGAKTAGFGKIIIQTSHPKDPHVDVPVNWRLAEPVVFTPRFINLGNAPVEQSINRVLTVTPRKREKFENLTFSTDNPMVNVNATPHPSRPHTWNLAFTLAPELQNKPVVANVLVDTHVEPEGQVRVRVTGRAVQQHPITPEQKAEAAKRAEAAKQEAAISKLAEDAKKAAETQKSADDKSSTDEKKVD
jgi:hypothetical protein